MARKRFCILLVDDEPDVLELLKETFTDDYDVLTASSGWTALDLLRTHAVDLLITDQRMPQITGVQLAERAHVDHPLLPIIILTAYTDPPDLIAAINKGQVYRFITKPWDVPHLMQTVEDALESVRLRRENAQLLENAQRRLDALKVMLNVLVAASATPSYGALVDTIGGLLEGVVPLDLSATLLRAEPTRPAELLLRLRTEASEAELLQLRDQLLERYRAWAGRAIREDELSVKLTGARPRGGASAQQPLRSTLFLPLRIDGDVKGVLCVAAREEEAFSNDDATILDLITNHAAELVSGLKQKLDAERTRMSLMVEGMGDGLVLTDGHGEVVVVNATARELLGLDDARAATKTSLTEALTFHPLEVARGLERGGAHAAAVDIDVLGHHLRAIVSPVTGPGARDGDVVTVLHDLTEEREREKRKEEFFADVSHELRTPLTAVAGALDLLLLKPETLNDSQRSYIALARGAASRLHSTIDDILDIARASRIGLELDLKSASLDAVAREAVARFEPSFSLAGARVDLVLPPEPLLAVIDPNRIGQVMNNLIGNALKFTPQGGRTVVEVFRMPDVTGTVGFSVQNDGPPIADEDRERIFLQYQRARSADGPRVKGTGLGLPIARTIVEAHHGRIWAEADPSGARFVAVIPIDGPGPIAPTTPTLEPGAAARPGAGAPARVLVVDDDRQIGYALKGVLLAAGFQVDLTTSADEAITLARKHHPQAFVVDMRMPTVDGTQLIELLRHDPDTKDAVIIAISSPDAHARARKAGADGFLDKPVDGSKLIGTLAQLTAARGSRARVLTVTSDAALGALCNETLTALGYAVELAPSAAAAHEMSARSRPTVVLLDVQLQDKQAFALLEALKAERSGRAIPVICMSAQADTRAKVRALQLGAEDCIARPFEPAELGARVENVLRRRENASASGGSALPGSVAIDREVHARLEARAPFTLCYVDLDNFKAFNDTYGYARADGVVAQTGDIVRGVVLEHGGSTDFAGHIAGDDFVFITSPERATRIAREVMAAFDRLVPLYYSREDRERGFIEADDRFGQRRRFPIMGISIVGVTDPGGRFSSHGDLAAVAAGLKKEAKAVVGSVFVLDDGVEKKVELPPR